MSTVENSTQKKAWLLRVAPWLGCLAIVILVVLATTQWHSWTSNRTIQTTQNAFVKSDFAVLSANVSGYITALPVDDFKRVKAGDVIAQIDDSDYQLNVAAAQARYDKANASLANLDTEIAQQQAVVHEARANVEAAEVRVRQHRTNPARQAQLVREGALSRQQYESAQAELEYASSTRDAMLAKVDLAMKSLDVLEGQRRLRQAELAAAQASLGVAHRDMSYTQIVAPFDGVLNKRQVQQGSLVAKGTHIVSIVPSVQPHIVANYKETQLARVQPGQRVSVSVDGLPGQLLQGRVSDIAPMSGAESALLPADNASGNFTKVVQRIPVRIDLEPEQEAVQQLRSGMSVTVSIDTSSELLSSTQTAHYVVKPDEV
ncbi:HlyD family secretion protein [Paenalcaligenes sp. Me131]|uniref:HlyD family secretion protein n=1 Tax=Paenalcaligenes sp. Me131 TaxID=3392636 RepID=UPI003D29CD99